MKRNVILSDMPLDESWDFRHGLEDVTKVKWEIRNCVTNQGRTCWYNIYRYIMYFVFPFAIFLNRNNYDKIVSWQAFHGVLFAFYSKLFHVKKTCFLLIKNFTYKPKNGWLGKIYYRWMRYIVKSKYVDIFVCTSQTFCEYCAQVFNEPLSRFVYLPFGVEDFTQKLTKEELEQKEDFILSLGRSNRDWNWLIECLGNTKYKVKIICDQLNRTVVPPNIEILNNIWFLDSYRYLARCKIAIIPIQDGKIGSGETVLLQTMSFGKPLIITRPSCLADDYVKDGMTGIIVDKDKNQLLEAISNLYNDNELYNKLSLQERIEFEKYHSIYSYGKAIGKLLQS